MGKKEIYKSVGYFTIFRSKAYQIDLSLKHTVVIWRSMENGSEWLYQKINDSKEIAEIERLNSRLGCKWEVMNMEQCMEYFVLRQVRIDPNTNIRRYTSNIKIIKKTDAVEERTIWGDTVMKAKSISNWQYYKKRG